MDLYFVTVLAFVLNRVDNLRRSVDNALGVTVAGCSDSQHMGTCAGSDGETDSFAGFISKSPPHIPC